MDLKLIREKALSDCPGPQAFWTCHGVVIRNVYELVENIKRSNGWAFQYHVNKDNQKNDFAKWIRDVVEDHDLADRLRNVADKDLYADIISQRIKELEEA